MKLHQSVVEKLIRIVDLHGGRKDDVRLRHEISLLDVSTYTQKDNPKKECFVILTEDLVKGHREATRNQKKAR